MSCPFHKPTSKPTPAPDPNSTASDEEVPPGLPIPHPPEKLLLGNFSEIDPNFIASSFWRLADIYGPIFSLHLGKRNIVVLSNHELINEVSDDRYYEKFVTGVQEEIRVFVKNGLFTSYSEEEEWGIAHRTLMPVFGPMHVRKMFPQMVDILSQMVLRWDRLGGERISTMDTFTRLAFDVIGLCAFNYRFNAFYGEELIPFAQQLGEVLIETGLRTNRPAFENKLHPRSKKHMMDNIHAMWKVCDDIVAERKANPRPDVDDILNVMLTAKDPVTGKGFTDENIRYQMATFLVAGHDTSAGSMMFLFYNLLQHPETLQKCYAEVDEVLGDRPLELEDLPKLKYIEASLRETLRFLGPIPAITRRARKTTLLAGKYRVTPDMAIVSNFKGLHHDPAVWGDDCNEFKPERFLNGGWEKLPANAWKPFGNGVRSCIGRYLAEQEIIITMAMVLQRFVVEMADPDYKLKIKSTLTIKPDNFDLKVRRRPGKDHLFSFTGAPAPAPGLKAAEKKTTAKTQSANLKPMAIYYGGNTGTCKSFAEDLETSAANHGLGVPDKVQSLDSAVEHLPTDRPVILITSSYEGLPPDNARNFVAWLETRAKDATNSKILQGVTYAVFGAGNKDWAATYHRIPKLVDELMAKLGATRLVAAGFVDVSQDIAGPFEDWKVTLFPKLRETAGITSQVRNAEVAVQITTPETPSKLAGEEVSEGTVLANSIIAARGIGPEKRQIDIQLPPDVEYRSGDYLAIQPFNPLPSVTRVLRHFSLHPDDLITITNTTKAHLLSPTPLTLFNLLSTRVELSQPITARQLTLLASYAPTDSTLATLNHTTLLQSRTSLLDILTSHPSIHLPFSIFIDLLPPLTYRQYSISSSPLVSPTTCSLTYDVHASPSLHDSTVPFHGVASTYLASLQPGSRLRCFVRTTNIPFRLPVDNKTPVIMIATGTGIAPMRAFMLDRVAVADARGVEVLGDARLYYGVRGREDWLYKEDLEGWEGRGIVKVKMAFSRPGHGEEAPTEGEKRKGAHVDQLVWEDREELKALFRDGAKILVCGSASRVGRSVSEVATRIWEEAHPGATREEAEEWLRGCREERFVSDVFG